MPAPAQALECPATPGPCECPGLPRCPSCGYTRHDASFWGDHGRCGGVIPGEPGSPERATYVEAPARFASDNPGVVDALSAADFRGEPFRSELAFGSPEAVEQAAERLYSGGSVFFRPGQEDILTKRRASTGAEVHYFIGPIRQSLAEAEEDRRRWASSSDLLPEALRATVASWKFEEEDWKRREGELLAEAVRLRAENAGLAAGMELLRGVAKQRDALAEQLADRVRRHESDGRDLDQIRVTVRDESRRAHEAELQVDALAKALESYRRSAKELGGPASPEHEEEARAWTAVDAQAAVALRKAGRL